jgi:ankyrin repeat protein
MKKNGPGELKRLVYNKKNPKSTEPKMQTVPFASAAGSNDFLVLICEQMTTLQQLAMLAMVNKQFRDFFNTKAGGSFWMALGRSICGARYWSDAPLLRGLSGPRLTRAMVCPWVSKGVSTVIDAVQSIAKLGDECEIQEMCLKDDQLYFRLCAEPYEGIVFTESKRFACIVPARPGTGHQTVEDVDVVEFAPVPMKDSEVTYLEQFRVKVQRSEYFKFGVNLKRAYLVNESVVGLQFQCGDKMANLIFCTTKDLRILRSVSVCTCEIDDSKPCVIFQPGEMWTIDYEACSVNYYGPMAEIDHMGVQGRVDPAFALLCDGRPEDALAYMRSIGAPLRMFGNFGSCGLMHYAACVGNMDAVRLFAAAGMNVNALSGGDDKKVPPICMAADKQHIRTMSLLVEHGADVNMEVVGWDSEKRTLLHYGIESGWSEAAILLLVSKRADVNSRNSRNGQTPMFDVVELMNRKELDKAKSVVKILIAGGADVNASSEVSVVLGHWVFAANSVADIRGCVDLIIEYGCDVNARYGPKKRTALMHLMERFSEEVIGLFVKTYRADVTLADADGKTALMLLDARTRKVSEGRVKIHSTAHMDSPTTLEMASWEMDACRRLLMPKDS